MNLHINEKLMAALPPDFLAGGGLMGMAMRSHDWGATPLGAPQDWPDALRTCLRILLASRQPMWLWWGPKLVSFHNDAALRVMGASSGGLGQPARQAWAGVWQRFRTRVEGAMNGLASAQAGPMAVRRDGTAEDNYYTFSFSPVPEEGGRIGGVLCVCSDDTGRVVATRQLALEIEHRRRVEQHQNALLDELNHRVKNTLATVQAMAMQTLRGIDLQARDAFLARLFALSSQHDLLTLDNWAGTSFEGVVCRALRPWHEEGRARFHVEGPAIHLDPKRALALGMGFHELATNAARYGALSNAEGLVHVTWAILEDGKTVRLRWEERGGPPVVRPPRKGFGLRLIEHGLGRELSGVVALDFAPDGLVCEWVMKLS
ncbi:MAG TPA: sensor histidine kinase [Rhizomicrobium sp.]|nr:sensor histidine kinase [Rhizomicrobium sp.]